jgi:hypothetical protein
MEFDGTLRPEKHDSVKLKHAKYQHHWVEIERWLKHTQMGRFRKCFHPAKNRISSDVFSEIEYIFADPDAAFAFKMRFV